MDLHDLLKHTLFESTVKCNEHSYLVNGYNDSQHPQSFSTEDDGVEGYYNPRFSYGKRVKNKPKLDHKVVDDLYFAHQHNFPNFYDPWYKITFVSTDGVDEYHQVVIVDKTTGAKHRARLYYTRPKAKWEIDSKQTTSTRPMSSTTKTSTTSATKTSAKPAANVVKQSRADSITNKANTDKIIKSLIAKQSTYANSYEIVKRKQYHGRVHHFDAMLIRDKATDSLYAFKKSLDDSSNSKWEQLGRLTARSVFKELPNARTIKGPMN